MIKSKWTSINLNYNGQTLWHYHWGDSHENNKTAVTDWVIATGHTVHIFVIRQQAIIWTIAGLVYFCVDASLRTNE